jgi:amino acid adenylation domain-containing protein
MRFDAGGPNNWPFEPFPDEAVEGSLVARFDATARRHAFRLAVSDLEQSWTYAELAAFADRIAIAVHAAASRPGPVAILLRNEARFPAAIFGVLATGRPFIPLDVDHPAERNGWIARHAGTAAVVSAGDLAERATGVFPPDVPILDIAALPQRGAAPVASPAPEDIAAILYTSGSTGLPKGVCQDHRSLLFGVQQWTDVMHLSREDRMALVTSPSSYAGIRNLLCPLLIGASLHILPPRVLQPSGLIREIGARGITVYRSVPTVFRHLVDALGEQECLDSIRLVSLGGDRADWADVERFKRACRKDAVLAVGLSSTEAIANYTWWFVDGALRSNGSRLPVGRTTENPSISLLGDTGELIEDDEIGEIVLNGRYLARGYWREPGLTAEAFGVDPHDPERRTYRTGDMARRRPDALFEFIGRKDHQLKLHGQRIEIAEVESALAACTGVRDAAVAVRRDSEGDPRALVAYAELRTGVNGLLPRHLLSMLSQRLPTHMMPSAIRIVAELPRLPNQKIDRGRLAALDNASVSPEADRNPLTAEVIAIFETVLGCSATADDNVLSLGGDSMQAVMIALELEQHFEIPIPIDAFEATQTIRELAAWIESRSIETAAAVASA